MADPLSPSIRPRVRLRRNLKPGDIGAVVQLHGVWYSAEYGYDRTFEGYVAAGMAEWMSSYDPAWDRLWVAETGSRWVGSIAIVKRPLMEAQLRWFLIHPEFRGQGLGRKMVRAAIDFAREGGYRKIYLWTVNGLEAAQYLYTQAGFIKTEDHFHRIWGKDISEERYELPLEAPSP